MPFMTNSVQLVQRMPYQEGFEDFKIGGHIIHTVKCADDLVLLAKEEKVLHDMIDEQLETGRRYGM